MSKTVILTGLRANNDLHIGNYFGALLPMVDMANKRAGEYQINLFVPDLHSFTTPIDHTTLYAQTMHNIKMFAAAGLNLNNPDLYIYRQSYIPAHSELTWILDCFTGFGQMARMTQFKDKASLAKQEMRGLLGVFINSYYEKFSSGLRRSPENDEMIERHIDFILAKHEAATTVNGSVGLFNYPVLMAADILLYGATYVPVGEDQTQHLEFTRDIAERMNSRFGQLFTVPKPVAEQHKFFGKDQGLRIKDLMDPTKKMSKSDETGKGVIFLGDDPAAAAKKIMSATTDSVGAIHYDRDNQPGICNLLQILALLTKRPIQDIASEWDGKTSYGELKKAAAEQVQSFLTSFQNRLATIDEAVLHAKLEASESAMRTHADRTLLAVQQTVGLRPAA